MSREDYHDIIELFEKADPIEPPDDFTSDVLRKIGAGGEGFSRFPWGPIEWPFLRGDLSRIDCFLHFAMVGIFYFILSLILRFGFDNVLINADFARGIETQWTFTFLFALTFIFLGVLLLKSGLRAVKVAEIATVVYIGLVFASGIALNSLIITVHFLPYVTVGFIVTGIAMGLFLVITLVRYERSSG